MTNTDKKEKYIYKNLTYKIIGCCYEIHKELGCVHKENIYHKALSLELINSNISFLDEQSIKVTYKGKLIGAYRPDFIIDEKVILEIKAVPFITKGILNQVYYYAKGTKYKLILLINFGSPKVEVKRIISDHL